MNMPKWKQIIAAIFWFVVTLSFFHFCTAPPAHAEELFELNEVSIKGHHFMGRSRHENLIDTPDKKLDLIVNVDVLKYGYFNNTIQSLTSKKLFKMVGWNFVVGIHVHSWLDLEYEHSSKHALDGKGPWQGYDFPVQDSVGFKIKFWQKDKPNALF